MENKNFIINSENKGLRLDCFLQKQFEAFSRSHLQNLIKNNKIVLERNNKVLTRLKCGEVLKESDNLTVYFEEPEKLDLSPENIELNIVYQDDDLAVINKPQGLVVHPSQSTKKGTLVNALLYSLDNLSGINGKLRPGIVHRLDKNTAGLIVVAKNDLSHVNLSKQIENKTCHRTYWALIDGRFKEPNGIIETYINRDNKDRKKMAVCDNGKLAITHYKTIEFFKDYSLVEFELKTGRTHQIRVHAKHLNHPIVGDDVYGKGSKFKLKGQFLCSKKLSFVHPTTSKEMSFEIPLPEDFENILNYLRKNNAE